MKVWMKWTGIAAAVLFATSAVAADHSDGNPREKSTHADLADLYAWAPPNSGELVMIQTIAGEFSPNVQYVFHVGRSKTPALLEPPENWTNIICTFEDVDTISCWAGEQDYVAGDPRGNHGLSSAKGLLRVHAGRHSDPLFFYRQGLTNTISQLRDETRNLTLDDAGCPLLDAPTSEEYLGLLAGDIAGPSVNDYATADVSAIVVEADKSLIDGVGEYFSIWASTHKAN